MKQKLRIVHIEDYFDPAAGYQINEMIKYNEDAEHVVISSYDFTPFHKEFSDEEDAKCEKKYNVRIIRLKSKFKVSQRIYLKSWLATAESYKPDVLFLHGIGDFKDLLLYKKKRNYLVVRDCHMSWIASRNRLASIYYMFFNIFFASIINSSGKYFKVYALGIEEKQYIKKIGVRNDKVELLPHGYDPNQFYFSETDRIELRKRMGITDDEFVISYIGKHNRYKCPDIIFDCINCLDPSFLIENKVVLLFVGSKENDYMNSVFNPKYHEIKSQIRILIEPAVAYNKLRGYYCASDVCFWPKETTLSSIHAQACGTSVIMEEQVSNKERVVEQKYLFKIDDVLDASLKLKQLIKLSKFNNTHLIEGIRYRAYSDMLKTAINSWTKALKC